MRTLVVYYSRTGVTKKAAEAICGELQAAGRDVELREIVDLKNRKGFIGWLGAVKDATLKRRTPIAEIDLDLAAFDLVVIGTPVWAFTMAAPVRTFCAQHGQNAQQVAFFCTMGNAGDKRTFAAMESLCGRSPAAILALIDSFVRKDDADEFREKVKRFAESLGQAKKPETPPSP